MPGTSKNATAAVASPSPLSKPKRSSNEVSTKPRLLPRDPLGRKGVPLTSGCLDYFPDALVAVAQLSWFGNNKHNPGEDLHWARSKSTDHADCIARHLIERGVHDADSGFSHTVALAWRALALLQEEIEDRMNLPPSRGSQP